MAALKRSLTIVIRVPFEPDGFSQTPTVTVAPEKQESYLKALRREVVAGAEDAEDCRVSLILFDGGTPANMTLATWCYFMDDIMDAYSGVPTARVRFDAAPHLINHKTAQYARRWHSCMNMLVPDFCDPAAPWSGHAGSPDKEVDPNADALSQALTHMSYEHCLEWGVETVVPVSDEAEGALDAARSLAARLEAYKPGYVRLHDPSAPVAPCIADVLDSHGYRPYKDGLFSNHAKYPAWFIENETDDVLGYGVQTVSRIGGGSFKTCDDVALYCEEAGISAAVYQRIE